jgi:hypothetical protein
MTKTQKIIVLAAAVMIIAAVLYPPCNLITMFPADDGPKLILSYSGWNWITRLLDNNEHQVTAYVRFDILSLEIFGILVLAGAGLLITKKK